MTPKQEALKQAIEARGTFLKANWWFGRIEARLYVECTIRDAETGKRIKTKTIYLTFDDPAECYGCKVEGRCHPAHRIAFYEALRIGNPETLPKFIAECNETEEWDGAPEATEAGRAEASRRGRQERREKEKEWEQREQLLQPMSPARL